MATKRHGLSVSLDWYVFRQVVLATAFIMFALTSAMWLIRSIDFIDLVINRGMSAGTLGYLTWLLLPTFIYVLLPISLVTAILFVYNRLITESELVIMRAAGLSALQLSRPALLAAALSTVICYAIALFFLPASQRAFSDTQSSFMRDFASVLLREGVFNAVSPGVVVYLRTRERNGELRGLIFHDNRDRNQPVTIMAERGALVDADGGPRVLMFNGNRQQVDPSTGKLSLLYFERFSVDLQRAQSRQTTVRRSPQERYIDELLADNPVPVTMLAEFHSRIVSPLTSIVYALIAMAAMLSGNFNRRGQNVRIIVAAIACTLVQVGTTIALQTLIRWHPLLQFSIYVPTIVSAGAALWLVLRKPGLPRFASWLRPALQG